jgi:hypothetical protein
MALHKAVDRSSNLTYHVDPVVILAGRNTFVTRIAIVEARAW